jgi:hypothetical protein
MALGLSNLTVSGKASAGAVVGTLSLLNASGVGMQANFMLDDDCAGFFGVSGNNEIGVEYRRDYRLSTAARQSTV